MNGDTVSPCVSLTRNDNESAGMHKGRVWTPGPRYLKGVNLLFGDISVCETLVNPGLDLS
jgi:hypothetical protein